MQIPKSLEPVWNKVSQDGVISKEDYKLLLKEAKTINEDKSVNKEVVNFIKNLNSQFAKTSGNEGSIPVKAVLSFADTSPTDQITQKNIGDVPEGLKQEWNKVIEDGKITGPEYQSLLKFVSSRQNVVLSDEEKDFLKNLQVLILSSKNFELSFFDQNKEPVKDKPADNKVAEPVVDKTEPKTTGTKKGLKLEDAELMNEMKDLLGKIGDYPELSKLRGIVDKRVDLNSKLEKFSSKADEVLNGVKDSKDVNKLKAARDTLKSEYENLGEAKDLEDPKALFGEVSNILDSQISKLSSKPNENNGGLTGITKPKKKDNVKPERNIPFVEGGNENKTTPKSEAPASLQKKWQEITKDGKLTADEFNSLLAEMKVIGEKRPDQSMTAEEKVFLEKYSAKINEALAQNKNSISVTPAKPTQKTEQKPAVETKVEASAFGKVPPSLAEEWKKLQAKGSVNLQDFDKLKLLAAPTKQNTELDPEEEAFLKKLATKLEDGDISFKPAQKTEQKPAVETKVEASAFGKVPPSLAEEWKKLQAKGSVNLQDFDKLKLLAAPTKQNTELDPEEEAFLKKLATKLEDGDISFKPAQKTEQKPAVETKVEASAFGKVPPSLAEEWKKLQAKGSVNLQDFDKLKLLAAPTKQNTELDPEEEAFLKKLATKLEDGDISFKPAQKQVPPPPKKTDEKKKVAPTPAKVENKEVVEKINTPFGIVPKDLIPVWKKLQAKGTIDEKDLNALKLAAAPNNQNEEWDKEIELPFVKKVVEAINKAPNNIYKIPK
ncbi:MAG: hypothetical protein U0457_06595 [Candidatus Sericytochromatia bacterium]